MKINVKLLKISAFALLFVVLFTTACKKNTPEEEVIPTKTQLWLKKLSNDLSSADSIRLFTSSLAYLQLKEEDIEEGLTVFAPLNEISPRPYRANKKGQVTLLESPIASIKDSILKEYIVKGVYKFSDLEDGITINNLNGRALQISRSADEISVGGLVISGEKVISDDERTVYAVRTVFP